MKTSIVKTVMVCASSNILLRRHSDDEGNFLKVLQFCIEAEDEDLKKRYARMTGNAKCTNPTIQNEISRGASTQQYGSARDCQRG